MTALSKWENLQPEGLVQMIGLLFIYLKYLYHVLILQTILLLKQQKLEGQYIVSTQQVKINT